MADDLTELVTVRHPATLQQRKVPRGALSGFTNQGYEVLTKDGRVNSKATSAATKKEI